MNPPVRNKIQALFFDLGGVCLTNAWEHESRQKAAKHFSLDYKEMERRHKRISARLDQGEISLQDYLSQVVFYKKRNFSRGSFIRFMKEESKPYPTTFDLLEKLKKRGYLLAALNNESIELNRFRIKKFRLKEYFTHFFSSCFLGTIKPESRIYEIALQVTQKNPRESLFIDDREENVKAARALKMNAIHLKDVDTLSTELKKFGIKY